MERKGEGVGTVGRAEGRTRGGTREEIQHLVRTDRIVYDLCARASEVSL